MKAIFKYSYLLFCVVILGDKVESQNKSEFMIRFADKNSSIYSTSNPLQFLSQRAINRRINQGISIKTNDLPVNQWYIDSVASTGVKILNVSKWLNALSIDTTGKPNALAKIFAFPFVVQVKAIGIKTVVEKDDQKIKAPANRYNKFEDYVAISTPPSLNYGSSFNQASMIGADCLHNNGYKGEGMIIAVIDAGFYKADSIHAFDSLRAHNSILGTRNFVNNKSVYQTHSHGMMVLSTMGGNLPGQLIGTAPNAKYWLLQSEDAATENIIEEFNWVVAAEFSDSVGVDVINSSLGYDTFDDPSQNHTYADLNGKVALCSIGATIAAEKGIIVVVSAGNSGPGKIGAPADADSILTIGAVDSGSSLASFSSRGPSFDKRIKPNVAAQGQGSIVATTGGGIASANGTSFSSPITAGAVACLWQANPGKTNMQIIKAVEKSGTQFTSPDSLLGYGIPNMCSANMLLGGYELSQFKKDNIIIAYPNPFEMNVNISFYSLNKQKVEIGLFDISGRKVSEKSLDVIANSVNYFTLENAKDLGSGIYILNIVTQSGSIYKKLIKN